MALLPGAPWRSAGLDPDHLRHCALLVRVRHLRARATGRGRRRRGLEPDLDARVKTILPIQVIGQQWKFTYRYPTFGGFETDQLVIPNDTSIEFNVTSLDVDPQLLGLPARA